MKSFFIFTFKSIVILIICLVFSEYSFSQNSSSENCPICWGSGKANMGLGASFEQHKVCKGNGCKICKWTGKVTVVPLIKCQGCGGTGKMIDFQKIFQKKFKDDMQTMKMITKDCVIKDKNGSIVKGVSDNYYVTDLNRIFNDNNNLLGTVGFKFEHKIKRGIPDNMYKSIGEGFGDYIGSSSTYNKNSVYSNSRTLYIVNGDNRCFYLAFAMLADGIKVVDPNQVETITSSNQDSKVTEIQNSKVLLSSDNESQKISINLNSSDTNSYVGDGIVWYDEPSRNNNGTLINNPKFHKGSPSYFQFDGNDDYITFSKSTIGSNLSNYSWGGWISPKTGTTEQIAFIRGDDDFGGWSLMISKKTTNILRAAVFVDGVEFSADSPTSFSDDTWYHVYAVWTKGVSLKLFINGLLVKTLNTPKYTLRSSSVGWKIGRFNSYLPLFWKGKISTFNMINKSLTDSEILKMYDSQKLNYGQ